MKKSSQKYFDIFNKNDEVKMFTLLSSGLISKSVYLGVKSGLFEKMEQGHNDVKSLAKSLNFNQDKLYRLLKTFEYVEIAEETEENKFALTSSGKKFLLNKKGSFAPLAILWGEEFHNVLSEFQGAFKSDKSCFELKYNENIYSYLNKNKATADTFNMAMRGLSENFYSEIPYTLDFSSIKTVADIGGGTGTLLREVVSAHKHLKGILFDQKEVINKARNELEEYPNKNRVELVDGDFFKQLPFKADCIMMANVIHNWNDEHAIQILTNCRKALNENGKVCLLEMSLEHSLEPLTARLADLSMLALTNGKERSIKEFEAIFSAAGLKFVKATNILNMTCLIETKAV